MALTKEYIKSQVKKILPIGETDIYDDQLDILVGGAVSKLVSEGLDNGAEDKEGNAIFTDADNHNVLLLKIAVILGKGTGLTGTAGGIILGIEIQNDLLTQKIGQTDTVAVLIEKYGTGACCTLVKGKNVFFHGFLPYILEMSQSAISAWTLFLSFSLIISWR